MLDFEVQRSTRKCCVTERELRAGERYFSVLVAEKGKVLRRDYSAEAWSGPPENAIGWWQTQIPHPQSAQRVSWAPTDVLLAAWDDLRERPDQAPLAFLLSLVLVRRKVLRLEENRTDSAGLEWLTVSVPRSEQTVDIPVAMPAPDQMQSVQDELARLLTSSE